MIRLMRWLSTTRRRTARQRQAGQIALFLILIIAGILIFTMMVANLGQLAVQSVVTANAADSAALLLGSQLASKSNRLYESLGHKTEWCVKSGMLGSVLAVILAVIIVIVTWGAALVVVIPAAAAAGAVGGAAGNAIIGMDPGAGAVQGAIIGAAIGAGAVAGAQIAGSLAATPTAVAVEGAGLGGIPVGATALVTVPATSGAAVTAGAALGAGLSAMGPLYKGAVRQQITADGIEAANKSLNGLPERMRIAMAVILDALSRTIDNPNRVRDVNDADGDGDTQEYIPHFQWWVDVQSRGALATAEEMSKEVAHFVHDPNGPLASMINDARATYACAGGLWCDAPGVLVRRQVEGHGKGIFGTDVSGPLEDALYGISTSASRNQIQSFWQPGPTWAQYDAWQNTDPNCTNCAAQRPPGWDEVDEVIEDLKRFVAMAGSVRNQDLGSSVQGWESWTSNFYNPNPAAGSDETDFYHVFQRMLHGDGQQRIGIYGWRTRLTNIRNSLPQCQFAPLPLLPGTVSNPPCRDINGTYQAGFANADTDPADEFAQTINGLTNLATKIESLQVRAQAFATRMNDIQQAAVRDVMGALLGLLPSWVPIPYGMSYEWQDDRGPHSVSVVVGPFPVPRTVYEEHGGSLAKEQCIVLKDYRDDWGALTFVVIIRKDPTDRPMKFWTWNRYDGVTVKAASARFSFDHVDLGPTAGPILQEILDALN